MSHTHFFTNVPPLWGGGGAQAGALKLKVPDETVSVLLVLEPFFLHAYPSLVTRPREGGRFGVIDGGTCLQEGVASE